MKKNSVKSLVYYGATTALVIIATAFIKIPALNGYIHLGDGIILVSGALLGPLGFIPTAIGSALADYIAGFPQYMLGTFLVKGLMGLVAGLMVKKKEFSYRNLLAFILVEAIMVAGYFTVDLILYNFYGALSGVPFNLIQGACGVTMGLLFVPATKRIKL